MQKLVLRVKTYPGFIDGSDTAIAAAASVAIETFMKGLPTTLEVFGKPYAMPQPNLFDNTLEITVRALVRTKGTETDGKHSSS